MKMPRQSCKVLMAIGLLAGVGLSDEKPPVPGGQSTKTPKTTKAQSKSLPEQRAWEEALGQVKLLAAKFQEYRDKAVASKSLAGLASEACQYDKDLALCSFTKLWT